MAVVQEFVVSEGCAGERLDRFLRRQRLAESRAALAELLASGAVRVNDRRASKGTLLRAGDRIRVERPVAPATAAARPDPTLSLRVIHEDAWLVAIDKPAGVPSHPLRAAERGTIASALVARYPEMAGVGHRPLEPGLLHRLDTYTSGVLIALRDQASFRALQAAHARAELDKRYLALVMGHPQAPRRVHAFMRADRRRVRVEARPFARARPIEAELLRSERHGAWALVELRVAFAARHQVRAQLAQLGHPIVGDALYGGPSLPGLERHCLHASSIALSHPRTGERLVLSAPLPADIAALMGDADRPPPFPTKP